MIQQLDRYRTPPDWQPGASLLLRSFGPRLLAGGRRLDRRLRGSSPRRCGDRQSGGGGWPR